MQALRFHLSSQDRPQVLLFFLFLRFSSEVPLPCQSRQKCHQIQCTVHLACSLAQFQWYVGWWRVWLSGKGIEGKDHRQSLGNLGREGVFS
ncbi:hypothetical protein FGO68_gene6196 [Halteria grandinella]|uniref:Uncharacterized protein n=1 Tax=Halteria grandinella TaxID=5974 RepID=A0A8J8NTB1_HALGN|nr:hypothetical protein FGO68_gene6196 [Halteria grandinella]